MLQHDVTSLEKSVMFYQAKVVLMEGLGRKTDDSHKTFGAVVCAYQYYSEVQSYKKFSEKLLNSLASLRADTADNDESSDANENFYTITSDYTETLYQAYIHLLNRLVLKQAAIHTMQDRKAALDLVDNIANECSQMGLNTENGPLANAILKANDIFATKTMQITPSKLIV